MFAALDPNVRVPWGIGMRAPSLITARLMETWAHGLDVFAALGTEPHDTDRLAHVAWLATRALPYAYTFAGREPPAEPLRVELTLPSGAPWNTGPDGCRESHHWAGRRVLPGVRSPVVSGRRARLVVVGPAASDRAPRRPGLLVRERRLMPLFSFEGLRPRIHPSAFVAPTATLVGDVIVEEGASVWYGVVIRAGLRAGDRAPARERPGQRGDPRSARAHDRRRASDDTIAHNCVVHGALLLEACIVANGSVVLDGATIGARRADRCGLSRRGRRVHSGGHARFGLARSRAAPGEGQRRRDVGRHESRRVRRARATPPSRDRVRRTRGMSRAPNPRPHFM